MQSTQLSLAQAHPVQSDARIVWNAEGAAQIRANSLDDIVRQTADTIFAIDVGVKGLALPASCSPHWPEKWCFCMGSSRNPRKPRLLI